MLHGSIWERSLLAICIRSESERHAECKGLHADEDVPVFMKEKAGGGQITPPPHNPHAF